MKSTTNKATIKHPAAILEVTRFVEASIRAIPQNDEPRSGTRQILRKLKLNHDVHRMKEIQDKVATYLVDPLRIDQSIGYNNHLSCNTDS